MARRNPAWPRTQNLLDLPLLTGVPVLGRIPAGAATLPVRQFRRDALEWLPVL